MFAKRLQHQPVHVSHQQFHCEGKEAFIGAEFDKGALSVNELDVVIAQLVDFGREIAPVVTQHLAVVTGEKLLFLGVGIEAYTAGVSLVGIYQQHRREGSAKKSAEDEFILVIGEDHIEPMCLIAHGGGEDVIGKEHGNVVLPGRR